MKSSIKIPTARQLPSGNWFVQLRLDGQSISITKPTQREAVAAAVVFHVTWGFKSLGNGTV